METIKTSLHHSILLPRNNAPIHPTILLIHGRGADENDLLGLAPYLDRRFFVISVQAPFRFAHGGYTWYDLREADTPDPHQFMESYSKLTQSLSDFRQHYPVDAEHVFFLGFSMGTVMAYALSLAQPGIAKGVVAHSGYVPLGTPLEFQWQKQDAISYFIAHGTLDPIIPIEAARKARELLSKTKATLTYREYPIHHQISEESLRDAAYWLRNLLEGVN
ncbi:MAG: alpha/beta fold hydrolase [Bacteroidota bacterium]